MALLPVLAVAAALFFAAPAPPASAATIFPYSFITLPVQHTVADWITIYLYDTSPVLLGSWDPPKQFDSASVLHTGSDDYPYSPNICNHDGYCAGIDDWGLTKQQCVSFVAWRLSQRGVLVDGATYGNAGNWDSAARNDRYTVDTTPTVGSVAQWGYGESSNWTDANGGTHYITASSFGHVAYVTAVNTDGTVDIEEYNNNGDQSYNQQFSIRAPRYIHF